MSFGHSASSFLDGLTRRAKERYALTVMDIHSGLTRVLPSPRNAYNADPFLIMDGDARWLFFEEFHYPTNRGYIAAARVDPALALHPPQRVLALECHASFPFVFRHDGAIFMMPETSHSMRVDLYACVAMPDQWRCATRLLHGVDCADSVLHRHGDLWYLITSQSDAHTSPNRWLAIYCSDALLSGPWTPHPVNAERRYVQRAHGYGRNAGALVDACGHLLRPMQASQDYYGQAMRVMEVIELSPSRYEEVPFEGEHLFRRIGADRSTHHISAAGPLVAWDTRTRVGYLRRPVRRSAPHDAHPGGAGAL